METKSLVTYQVIFKEVIRKKDFSPSSTSKLNELWSELCELVWLSFLYSLSSKTFTLSVFLKSRFERKKGLQKHLPRHGPAEKKVVKYAAPVAKL